MGEGTLTIYNASAGSGKTFTLAAVYLNHIFRSRYNYRHILAVTFTNKATAEMKSRILDNLYKIGNGMDSEYIKELTVSTGKDEEWIRSEASEILNCILHDYSRFSVSTIDSFFQKILRAFTREAGLNAGFTVEMDNSLILSAAVDKLLSSAAEDPDLKTWMKDYALSNIEEDKTWNIREGILALAGEIFREKFKIMTDEERHTIGDRQALLEYIRELKRLAFSFISGLKDLGSEAESLYSEYGLDDSMFYQKGRGVPSFIRSLASGTVKEPTSYVLEVLKDPPRWSSGRKDAALAQAINAGLERVITSAIDYYRNRLEDYRTAKAIISNIYSLGILSDIIREVRLLTASENTFLLSEAGDFLSKITGGDQTSFIYEKAGNRFDSFMIDEFQDTSELQWLNFSPLIGNSMAQGHDNLVVGDVKQSIYRWRSSDWKILGSVLNSQVDNERIISKSLVTNWRSCTDIIRFNNSLFSVIPDQIDKMLSSEAGKISFRSLYTGVIQKDAGKRQGGYVRIEFLEDTNDNDWEDAVLDKLPQIISGIIDKGYKASEIGIIVRNSSEGAKVLGKITDYNNLDKEERLKDPIGIVSNDSLVLGNSPVLNFIEATLAVAKDPCDMISRALMLRNFLLSSGRADADSISIAVNTMDEVSAAYFPAGYREHLNALGSLTLFEATEEIIRFYDLGKHKYNIPYLNAFQDLVLSFPVSGGVGVESFLEWWNETGRNKSVVLPENQDAVRILTIHKSKGLEFGVVILPFLSWGLDHLTAKPPVMWVRPASDPFNRMPMVPVRYGRNLEDTKFRDEYSEEKFAVHIDNINLLYVALTRAKDAIYGFCNGNPKGESNISAVLKKALLTKKDDLSDSSINLPDFFDETGGVFELGQLKTKAPETREHQERLEPGYPVNSRPDTLKLRLHGEYYFKTATPGFMEKINYGLLMHEVFAGIDSAGDVKGALQKLVAEGKINKDEVDVLEDKILGLLSAPVVSEWFAPENKVLKEASVILPSGISRRPDRIVFRDGRTIIIDFKFGDQNPQYVKQLSGYKKLLSEMGYENTEAFLWYVDNNVISSV